MSRRIAPTDHTPTDARSDIPDGVAIRCDGCKEVLFAREHERNGRICPHCQYAAPLGADARVRFLVDDGSFEPLPDAPADFVIGRASIDGTACVVGAISPSDSGTDGTESGDVNDVLTTLLDQRAATVLFCAGGVGMDDGAVSGTSRLKAHRALSLHGAARLPYLLVITDPHPEHGLLTGAPLGDLVVAETAVRNMPPMIQPRQGETSPHPFVDIHMPRAAMQAELSKLLMFFAQAGESDGERQD